MNFDYHRLPGEMLDALAAGGGGAAAMEALCRSQYSKHALLLHGVAMADSPRSGPAYDLLRSAQHRDPGAVAAVVRHPAVGAWAYRTLLALRGDPPLPDVLPDGLAGVAAAAAIRARLTAEIDVPARSGVVMLPSLGAASLGAEGQEPPVTATVRIRPEHAEVNMPGGPVVIPADWRQPAPGWRPLRGVLTGIPGAPDIVVDDVDPFRMPAAPHVGPAPDLDSWRPVFAQAWTLLRRHHPEVAAEVAAVVTVAVPLISPPEGQASSSSPETFGAIALSEPVDPVSLAVTFAHEVNHMKLSAVLDIVPLIHQDDGKRYYAPWRDDPRPASGLLQGAYAFLGVTEFWRRQRTMTPSPDSLADIEFARWRESAALVCQTLLGSGQLTEDGLRFVTSMTRTLKSCCAEPVPTAAQRRADNEKAQHMARWTARNGPVPAVGSDLR